MIKTILWLADSAPLAGSLRTQLETLGYYVVTPQLGTCCPDLVLVDRQEWVDLTTRAAVDFLTNVLNRGTFTTQAQQELVRAKHTGEPISCVMIDLDRFKTVNDTHGHPTGDLVLQFISKTLQTNCRGYDLIGRLGGEEFILLLPKTDLTQAGVIAERIRQVVANTAIPTTKGPVLVTLSMGVSSYRLGESLDALIWRADDALFKAKAQGRDCVAIQA